MIDVNFLDCGVSSAGGRGDLAKGILSFRWVWTGGV